MTWLASDAQAEQFTASKAQIAQRAGVSYRKVADVLSLLVRLGLVEAVENMVAGTKERGPNTYTLGTVCTTPGTECLRLGTAAKTDPCRDSEKNVSEESREESSEEDGRSRARRAPAPTDEEWIDSLKSNPGYSGIDVDREFAKCAAWCQTNRRQNTRRRFINWLNRAERPINAAGRAANGGFAGEIASVRPKGWGPEYVPPAPAASLGALQMRRQEIVGESNDIYRPGGCAFMVEPTDPAKRARAEELKTQLDAIKKRIETAA
jgi:hypothetical protein